ncbi:AraC family transcriptional regulator [Paenibacillus sp. Marseille-Q4541]|uniref:AraC family transcriptional regulator n=1 Tax=Paenibacillus sp. Marseille-Q4541 TaxID=2831522 RepID=UPI001BAE3E17|nr:AraC family transcriptional regulator [Paenibacillus sp. Marseille-Q4541]
MERSDPQLSYPFELMKEQKHALEQLHVDFTWGSYGIRVVQFHLVTFPPGKIIEFHKHSHEYEFHFIPRGSGKVIIENQEYQLSEGMMYLTGPNVMHYQEASAVEAMDELCLSIEIVPLSPSLHKQKESSSLSLADAELWNAGALQEQKEADACIRQLDAIPYVPESDRFKAMDCFLTAYTAWYQNEPGLYTLVKQAIINILLRTTRAYFPHPGRPLPSRDMGYYRYRLAEQFMKDNYMEPLTLEVVADRIQISPRQLQRIVRENGGHTFSEMLETIRLSHICKKLLHSDRTMDDIAEETGYSSANYVHYVFKRAYGLTPMQYREQHKQRGAL